MPALVYGERKRVPAHPVFLVLARLHRLLTHSRQHLLEWSLEQLVCSLQVGGHCWNNCTSKPPNSERSSACTTTPFGQGAPPRLKLSTFRIAKVAIQTRYNDSRNATRIQHPLPQTNRQSHELATDLDRSCADDTVPPLALAPLSWNATVLFLDDHCNRAGVSDEVLRY